MIGRTNAFASGKNSSDVLGLKITNYSGTYDGSSHSITASVNSAYASSVTLEYSTDNESWSQTKPTRTAAGTTTVYVRAVSEEFDTAYDSGTISISPAAVTLTANSSTKSYNGSSQSVTGFTASVPELSFNGVTASGSGTNVGSYTVSFSGVTVNTTKDTTGNYVVTEVVNGTLKIQALKVTATITLTSASYTYNGSARTLNHTFSSSNTLYTSSMCTVSGGSISRTDAGSVTSSISAKNNNTNFNVTFDITDGTLTINPAAVTLTASSGTKTYTGSSQSISGFTASVSGLTFASTVKASGSGTNAGTYTVSFSGATVNTTKDTTGNYVVTKLTTGTLTINPASVTLTASSGSKTYTGSSQSISGFTASVSGLSFSGVSASGSGTDAGTYTVKFSGATVNTTKDTTGNYVVTKLTTGTLTINPASVTLTASSGTKTYTGKSQSVSGFSSSVSGLTFSGVSASGSGTNAGTYTVSFSGATANTTKDSTGNYIVTKLVNGTLTINPAAVTLTASSGTKTYTGSSQSVSGFTSSVSGLSFASTVKASGSGTNAGSYTVSFSGVTVNTTKDTTGNYVVTKLVTGTLTISKAAASKLGLTVTSYSGYYDGSAHTVTAKVSITSGTTIQYSTDNSTWSTTAPTRSAAGTTTVYVRAVNDNYNTATATGTITINQKATLIVSWASGQYCSLFDPDENAVFEYSTSGYWSGTPSKTGTYYAICSNADPTIRTVNVTSTTSGTYTIAW